MLIYAQDYSWNSMWMSPVNGCLYIPRIIVCHVFHCASRLKFHVATAFCRIEPIWMKYVIFYSQQCILGVRIFWSVLPMLSVMASCLVTPVNMTKVHTWLQLWPQNVLDFWKTPMNINYVPGSMMCFASFTRSLYSPCRDGSPPWRWKNTWNDIQGQDKVHNWTDLASWSYRLIVWQIRNDSPQQ